MSVTCLYSAASHHPDGSLVEHGNERQHGAGATDDGQRLARESGVDNAGYGRSRDHLQTKKKPRAL